MSHWLGVLAHALAVEVKGPTLSSLTRQFRKKHNGLFSGTLLLGAVWFWVHTKPPVE